MLKYVPLKTVLQQEYDTHMNFLKHVQLQPQQQRIFDHLQQLYYTDKTEIFKFMFPTVNRTVFNDRISSYSNIYENMGRYYLTSSELNDIFNLGVIQPKTIADIALVQKLYQEAITLFSFIKKHPMGKLGHNLLATFFLPSLHLLLDQHLEKILQPVKTVFNLSGNDKLYLATKLVVIQPNNNKYSLHNDCNHPAEEAEATSNTGMWLNFHIALSDVTANSAPLYFFPGSHKHIYSPNFALKNIILREPTVSDEELMLFFKGWAILHGGGLLEPVRMDGREFYNYELVSPMLYRYYLARHTEELGKIESSFFLTKAGDYVIFLPSLLHHSLGNNIEETPRISLLLRIVPEKTIFTQAISFDNFYKLIEMTFKGSVHAEKLSMDTIVNTLINNIDPKTDNIIAAILLTPNLCEGSCITVETIKKLHCNIGFIEADYCYDYFNPYDTECATNHYSLLAGDNICYTEADK